MFDSSIHGARLLGCALLALGLAACGGGDPPIGVVAAVNPAPERNVHAALPAAASSPAPAAPTASIVIRRQPTSLDAREGEVVQFEVEAQAPSALRYQWLRNGQPIGGQNGPVLQLRALAEDHLARISVVVHSGAEALQSDPALLRVAGS